MSIDKLKKAECCGCASCVISCPQKCINYLMDEEGFKYPVIDKSKCINCNKCENICPSLNSMKKTEESVKTYIAYNKNDEIKMKSSSGGVFQSLAQKVIELDGVVYGAAFNEKFEVQHVRISKKDDLDSILKSKYVQSEILNIFQYIEKDLKENKIVLFCGTPCQICALRKNSAYAYKLENLILVDFICHGVPSPGVWKSYLNYLENIKLKKEIDMINFRDKAQGWHNYSFSISIDKTCKRESHEINTYMRTFLSDKNIRPSCYNCFVKPNNYESDITLGDAWKIEKEKTEWADDKGTSLIITRTKQGENILNKIKADINILESDYERWKIYNPSLCITTIPSEKRTGFFADFNKLSDEQFWKKNEHISLKLYIKYLFKKIIKYMRLEKIMRKLS